MRQSPIICLEGPSAVGKTSLAGALAATFGAAIVPELDTSGAPPAASAEPWFTQAHVRRWREALHLSGEAPFVVIDCDPLKGLWYNWMHAEEGWPRIDTVGTLYREQYRCDALDFPDLYIFLDATEAALWARRNADPTRSRRGFQKHVRHLNSHRRYFRALQAAAPSRVRFLETTDQASLPARVHGLIETLPIADGDSQALLEIMILWIDHHAPADAVQLPLESNPATSESSE